MTDNILDTVRERVRREMNDVADDVALGGCLSTTSADMIAVAYAQKVGLIEGLARIERIVLDTIEEIEAREKLDT